MPLGEAFRRRTTLSYVYALGDNWQDEITLEATRQRDAMTTYGDGPDSTPFDQVKINNRLGSVNGGGTV